MLANMAKDSGNNKTPADITPNFFALRPRMSSEDSSSAAAAGASASGSAESGSQSNRSIVVDAAFFEEQFLRCQVCHERFDQSERSPKSLPCNHTFCLPCLTQIFDHAQPPTRRNLLWADDTLDGTLKCPTCRVEIYLSKNKIKDLPNDHRVVQMMDFLSQAVSTTQNACTKHERQPLNFFCKHCLVPVCRDCTVLDHKEQQGHIIVDVKQALSDNSGEFIQMEEKSRQILERMKARSDSLANASKRLDIQERQLRGEIKETFIEYRLLLEKRQEALTGMVQQKIRDQKALINTRFVNVCEHGTQLQKLFDSFSQAKNSNDVEQLFTLHKQMKDHEAQFNAVAAADDNELFKSCTFESTAEGEFLSGISSLGEVSVKDDLSLKQPVSAHQLMFLDMEDQRERERQAQYMAATTDPDDDPDRDTDDLADAITHDARYYDEIMERLLMTRYGDGPPTLEDMEQEPAVPRPRSTHPRRRPRVPTSSSSGLPLGMFLPGSPAERDVPMLQVRGDSSGNSRSNSRSRRSRDSGSRGQVQPRSHADYPRVVRHTQSHDIFQQEDSN
ncbi:hypothetical protein BaRGS_00018892 [Batillaria attramentaria]|uniref:Uncharacterized protein n=1 Tax=Batillaria attramentaria TaxID=370345 RepID=A0ABD0KRH1_9CAEN